MINYSRRTFNPPKFPSKPKESISFLLDGLTVKKVTTIEDNGKSTVSYQNYPLVKVTPEELMEKRLSKKPIIILKCSGNLYCGEFEDISIMGYQNIGKHLCGNCSMVCHGCPKVDDWTISHHLHLGYKWSQAVYRSGRIEKYSFIPFAVETFNCSIDAYIILECSLYKKYSNHNVKLEP